jgi:hypothetical protein
VTTDEIYRIARILASDTTAVKNREEIYGILRLPLAELTDLKRNLAYDGSGSYEFFVCALSKYRAKNGASGTVEELADCLKQLGLTSADYQI